MSNKKLYRIIIAILTVLISCFCIYSTIMFLNKYDTWHIVKLIIIFFIYLASFTLFHELGHGIMAKIYIPQNNIKIVFFPGNKSLGRAYVSDNYASYSPKQIRSIAWAGTGAGIIYGLIMSAIVYFLLGREYSQLFIEFIMILNIIPMNYFESPKNYLDSDIIAYPSEFKDFMNNLPVDSNKRYENVKGHIKL